MTTPSETYRGYFIEFDPPPIPLRNNDWSYWHEDYDGPGDVRCGTAASFEAAKAEIDRLILEEETT